MRGLGITVAPVLFDMMRNTFLLGFAVVSAIVASACSDGFGLGGAGGGSSSGEAKDNPPGTTDSINNDPTSTVKEAQADLFAGLKTGDEQTNAVCARGERNRVTDGLCGGKIGGIKGINDVLTALKLQFRDRTERGGNAINGNPGFALLGHSSSLIARNVSAINPRAFVFTAPPGTPTRVNGYTVVGFTRGENFVELASEDPNTKHLTFYLLRFEKDCEGGGSTEKHSCTNGDLFLPDIESNWRNVTLYDDDDLKNTMLDCLHCHQPNKKFEKALLMRELRDPWTHWFRNDKPGGIELIKDFVTVHEGEDYGGIPAAILQKSDPRALEDLIQGIGEVPSDDKLFSSTTIEREVKSSAPQQPAVNVPAGRSPTWQRLYDLAVAGQELPPPYHDVKVTDPQKLLYVQSQYLKLKRGELERKELPDVRRVFLDEAMPDLSFYPKKNATGREVLLQACAQCHQPDLDTSLSRARFDMSQLVNGTMPKAMKELAKARMRLPSSDPLKMPPLLMREIPRDALEAAIAELDK